MSEYSVYDSLPDHIITDFGPDIDSEGHTHSPLYKYRLFTYKNFPDYLLYLSNLYVRYWFPPF